jgi:hypothetical protein
MSTTFVIPSTVFVMFIRNKSEFNKLHWCGSLVWSMLSFQEPWRTQFASRDSFYYERRLEYLSSKRRYHKLTTFYKMHNKLNINLLESTAVISNGIIVHTGAEELPLKHMFMNSNLILIVLELGHHVPC